MKKIVILLLVSFTLSLPKGVFSQNVGIGTNTPHPNAQLDISGINKGLLIPRGDAVTRTALNSNTAKGLIIYDTTTNTMWVHNGNGLASGWLNLSTGTNYWFQNGDLGTEIKNTNSGGFWSSNPSTVATDPGIINPPYEDAGTRLMWIPAKSAFRAGTVSGLQWDADKIGTWSFAGGFNAIASGQYSFAVGRNTEAAGVSSASIGFGANATGDYSFAAGGSNAIGTFSFTGGLSTISRSYGGVALGRYNDSIAGSNPLAWVPTDPLLMLGNGTAHNARSNALVVYQNGNTDISGYTQLGKTSEAAPAIKMKKLAVNTPAVQGGFALVAHGVTQTKILSITALVTVTGGFQIIPNHEQAGFKYTLNVDNANIAVGTVAGNSASILNMPVKILIVYEE